MRQHVPNNTLKKEKRNKEIYTIPCAGNKWNHPTFKKLINNQQSNILEHKLPIWKNQPFLNLSDIP